MTPANYGTGGYQSLANERQCDNVQHSQEENKFVRSCYDVLQDSAQLFLFSDVTVQFGT